MNNIIKKFLAVSLLILLTVLLSGCFEGENGDNPVVSGQLYEETDFSLSVEPTWKVVTASDFYAEIPNETVVAFTSPESYDGFFINVNVIREDLGQEVTSLDYARANINLSEQNLTDYEKIQEAKFTLGESDTLIHIFQARLNPAEKLIRFVQLYGTKGTQGYIVTGGMLPTTPKDIRDTVGAMVTSFRLK